MKTLLFDTETSGLFSNDYPDAHPYQPHIVQFGLILMDDDVETAAFKCLIKPTGWSIHPKAASKHGITVEQCEATGIDIKSAISVFDMFYECVDNLVGFNVEFDIRMLFAEQSRLGQPIDKYTKPYFCMMRTLTPIMKLKFAHGGGGGGNWKWPKLEEAYKWMYNKELEKAHDALVDIRATGELFTSLRGQQLIPGLK